MGARDACGGYLVGLAQDSTQTKVGLASLKVGHGQIVSVMVVCTSMYDAGSNGGFLESEWGMLLMRVAVGIQGR